jgi:uracil-DNA glycosylase
MSANTSAGATGAGPEEERFRAIFRAAHTAHPACADDEWLHQPCMTAAAQPAARPLVWSRRNGAWRRVEVLWVGAAPGNAGGLGSGSLGAHATRIPFGGDIAGGNLDVMLSAMGITRNETFLVAALNQLPERGGGEPTAREIAAPVGDYSDSVALLRDTILAAGPRLIIALGNVALRVTAAALTRHCADGAGSAAPQPSPPRLPGTAKLTTAGFVRGRVAPWPEAALPLDPGFRSRWREAWQEQPAFDVLQVLHPSAQNMSPFAGTTTVFHERMLVTLDALRTAVRDALNREPPELRQPPPATGIYSLPEWTELVGPAHRRYDELWRARGV